MELIVLLILIGAHCTPFMLLVILAAASMDKK
jgi:hypothetical protein